MADDEALSRQMLGQASLDLGFEAVTLVQRGATGRAALLWRNMGSRDMSMEDPWTAAVREKLEMLDAGTNRWVMRQNRILSHEDLLARDWEIFAELMQLPVRFGHAPWRTILSMPYRIGSRCFTIGFASTAPYRTHLRNLDNVRFLSHLYFAAHGNGWDEAARRQDEKALLQPKQVECLRWAAAGKAYNDIADIIGISPRTVRFHLDSARMRYGYATITQTIVQAAKDLDLDPLDAR